MLANYSQTKLYLGLFLLLLTPSCTAPTESSVPSPENSWEFQPAPDQYDKKALLDLRYLNEKMAGESGFIRLSADGRDFLKGDGKPIRFWAVNSDVWHKEGQAELQDNARFLAKRGVNMVRWHGQIAAKIKDSQLTDIDEKAREKLWQYVAAMKQQGIYLTLSPYYANILKPQSNWGIPRDSSSLHGLLFFDPKLQSAYKIWLRKLLEPVNPYTGIPLKDDPAIAIIQLQNEDSLLFWTISQVKGRDLDILSGQFAQWLSKKYGSLTNASIAWEKESVKGDNFAEKLVRFYPISEMTQSQNPNSGKGKRLADQTQFYTETMRNFNGEMAQFLRKDIGAKQLINAGNWKTADPVRLNDAERYSYTTTEVIGVNRYYNGGIHQGEFSGWAIVNGDKFTNESVLFNPLDFPLNIKQVAGHPTIIPETSWVPPLGYQSEGPFLVSVFQSLTGIDGVYWFSMKEPQWQKPSSANGFMPSLGKWIINTPELLGNFPAASLMYRQGYIQTGKRVVEEKRSFEDLWQRQIPAIAETRSFDPNRDQEVTNQDSENKIVNPLAFLVGPTEVTYQNQASKNEVVNFQSYIDEKAQIIRSITGEIVWDYGKGICQLDTPKAQGVTGFLDKVKEIKLKDSVITSNNNYATVLIVSMDNKPLTNSKKILVQVGTIARSTGWQEKAISWKDKQGNSVSGLQVINYGQAPWRLINNDLTITINNPNLTQGTIVDSNGLAEGKVSLQGNIKQVSFKFPANAKYLILE
ncbi:hypothetical protein [Aphanothece sacrum]|uniref:Glycoside hydrolase n=1 Tax=Aphanothece sacrum FPU1 TaxID=1920663 RepID=A0A401IEV7_APHSA|nr:hypothetical protein [Aphanothece sacrum]GBF79774.1 hypothetical protein AsFPU1_1173 [Aphanothece sacrum FPU1]GBF84786.1 hypothetical protein AsFPU3_1840 [Aphanothece sacrum FPU3]